MALVIDLTGNKAEQQVFDLTKKNPDTPSEPHTPSGSRKRGRGRGEHRSPSPGKADKKRRVLGYPDAHTIPTTPTAPVAPVAPVAPSTPTAPTFPFTSAAPAAPAVPAVPTASVSAGIVLGTATANRFTCTIKAIAERKTGRATHAELDTIKQAWHSMPLDVRQSAGIKLTLNTTARNLYARDKVHALMAVLRTLVAGTRERLDDSVSTSVSASVSVSRWDWMSLFFACVVDRYRVHGGGDHSDDYPAEPPTLYTVARHRQKAEDIRNEALSTGRAAPARSRGGGRPTDEQRKSATQRRKALIHLRLLFQVVFGDLLCYDALPVVSNTGATRILFGTAYRLLDEAECVKDIMYLDSLWSNLHHHMGGLASWMGYPAITADSRTCSSGRGGGGGGISHSLRQDMLSLQTVLSAFPSVRDIGVKAHESLRKTINV